MTPLISDNTPPHRAGNTGKQRTHLEGSVQLKSSCAFNRNKVHARAKEPKKYWKTQAASKRDVCTSLRKAGVLSVLDQVVKYERIELHGPDGIPTTTIPPLSIVHLAVIWLMQCA